MDIEENNYFIQQDNSFTCEICLEETADIHLHFNNGLNLCTECAFRKAEDVLLASTKYEPPEPPAKFNEDIIFFIENTQEVTGKFCTHKVKGNTIPFLNAKQSFCKICGFVYPF